MRKIDLDAEIGKQYHRITILSISPKEKKYKNGSIEKFVVGICSCGIQREFSFWQLRSGHTKSCGCYGAELRRRGVSGENRALLKILRSYTQNAKKRNIKWELTNEQAITILRRNCTYCDGPPTLRRPFNHPRYTPEWREQIKVEATGIDRVDNTLGYTLSNSVPCCSLCNRMKHTLTREEYIQHIQRVYQHQMLTET